MASFSAPNNNLQTEREALGWTMQQLADFAKSRNIQLSAKTVARVESGKGLFARVTFSRILLAINAGRIQNGQEALKESALFPALKQGS